MMKLRIRIDPKGLRKIHRVSKQAAEIAIEAVKTDVIASQVMPFDTGDMQNNQTFTTISAYGETTAARLVTGAPQARRLYYHPEYNFQTVHNANAGAYWLEPWIHGGKKNFAFEAFVHALKAGLK